ncbi:MAG: hypothetical protein H6995_06645 [Pseudomonadales bacterium]|nr:hypothetical protein [Pseudomonadales bacterium]MCP5303109.1 hypothetical protein [Pseudomonadales bacterium]
MKIFGYKFGSEDLYLLNEVTLQGSPEELKKLADFLIECAQEMVTDKDWEHEHFKDFTDSEVNSPDFIVYASEKR